MTLTGTAFDGSPVSVTTTTDGRGNFTFEAFRRATTPSSAEPWRDPPGCGTADRRG